jgi:hypothetical protein
VQPEAQRVAEDVGTLAVFGDFEEDGRSDRTGQALRVSDGEKGHGLRRGSLRLER